MIHINCRDGPWQQQIIPVSNNKILTIILLSVLHQFINYSCFTIDLYIYLAQGFTQELIKFFN